MAKKKGAKALFEVINDRGKSKPLGVPGWFDRARAAFSGARAQADLPGQDAPAAHAAPAPPPSPAAWAGPTNEPMVSMQDGRVRISLNQVSAVVSVLGFLLVMSGAFYFGRQMGMGHKDLPSVASAAQSPVPATPDKPAGGNAPGKATASARSNQAVGAAIADEGKRKKGLYYLVIQGGIRDQQDARTMIDFLADNDVAASAVRDSTNRWKVLADKAFSRADGKDVQDYKTRIGQLGKDYMRKHPYDFRDCYPQMEK
jgi:hypothetical protein